MNEHPRLAALRSLGSFQGVVQVVPTQEDVELLTNPADPSRGAGSGDLINHGGRTLSAPKMVNIYLGSMSFSTADFDAFSKALLENGYYVGPTGERPQGKFLGSKQFPTNPFPMSVADFQVGGTLDSWLRQGGIVPADDGQVIYSFIFPVGTVISLGSDRSCSSFCGFHEKSSGGHMFQVIVDGTCIGCHGSFSVNDSRMMIQSHEVGESISDPDGQTWYDSSGFENGDKCAWNRITWGLGWAVQPLWVNGRGCTWGVYTPSPVPVPNPPPPVPNPPPVPPPTTGPVLNIIVKGPLGTAAIQPVSLPPIGVATSIVGSLTYPDRRKQTFGVGLSSILTRIRAAIGRIFSG